MINITFPDGAVREFESGVTTFDIAQSISNSLAKKALAGKFNGKLIDTTRAITEDGSISSKIAKKVFVHLAKNGGGAREYVEKAGLVQISDPEVLIPIIHQVFADNEAAVADFKSGKRNADKAFTGFLMKATKGQANPQVALKLLAQELAKLKEE